MNCELCGKEAELLRAIIEGSELNVCKACSTYGRVVGRARPSVEPAAIKMPEKEIIEVIVPDYAARIKLSREKTGLKQEEMAKRISEKESVIHNVETGKYKPNIDLARKLEKFLKITLVEQYEDAPERKGSKKGDELTIGDFVRIKKK